MAISEGMVVYVNYGEVPRLYHSRLVVGTVDAASHLYMIATPDGDLYSEILHDSNPDYTSFHLPGPNNGIPPGIRAANVYGFAPMTAQEFARLMTEGRNQAAIERGQLGLGVPGAAAPAAPVGGPVVANPPAAGKVWVMAEMCGALKIGAVVNPPAGFPVLGDYGMMSVPDGDGGNRTVLIKNVEADHVAAFCEERIQIARASEALEGDDRAAADDIRTMSVRYTANGERFRSFRESVGEMNQTEMSDFPYEPRTCLSYLQAVQSVAENSYAQHLAWVQQSKIPEGARATFEDETLSHILDLAVSYDSLAVSNLACFELLVRRKQLIAEAHAYNPMSPSYEGSEYWLGSKCKHGGAIVVPALTEHVSKKLQADSAIMKERRKLEEAKGKSKGKPPKTAAKQQAASSSS